METQMIKESYLENKEFALDTLQYQFEDSNNPFVAGTTRLFDYELRNPTDIELFLNFVATGLFQLEKNGLEERVKEQLTYWIYQFKRGKFQGQITDLEELQKDINKIESMTKLKFEDLECYEADK